MSSLLLGLRLHHCNYNNENSGEFKKEKTKQSNTFQTKTILIS